MRIIVYFYTIIIYYTTRNMDTKIALCLSFNVFGICLTTISLEFCYICISVIMSFIVKICYNAYIQTRYIKRLHRCKCTFSFTSP